MTAIYLTFTKPPFTDKQIKTTVANISRLVTAEVTNQQTKPKRRLFQKSIMQVNVALSTPLTMAELEAHNRQILALKVPHRYKLVYR